MTARNCMRERSVIVAFRCTPEEDEALDRLVAMSGMTKQGYIMARLKKCRIEAVPSVRLYKNLSDVAKSIYLELRRIHDASELDEHTVAVMESLVGILKDLGQYDESEVSPSVREGRGIMDMPRE